MSSALMASAGERIQLPGFGLPMQVHPTPPNAPANPEKSTRFPHAIADYFASNGVTERELRMLDFVNQITDKPDWHRKVSDEQIVKKWEKEAVRFDETLDDFYLSEKMFEVCLEELREKAAIFEKTQMVHVLDAELTVVKSDSMVPTELQQALLAAVRPLEDVPENQQDWHPGSDNQVLDLVHPSLFPLVYGLSRVLPVGKVPLDECAKYTGLGETIPIDTSPRAQVKQTSWGNELHQRPTPPETQGSVRRLGAARGQGNSALERYPLVVPHQDSDKRGGTGSEDYEIPDGLVYDGPDNMIGVSESDDEYDERLEMLEDSDEYRDWKEEHQVLIQREPHDYVPFKSAIPEGHAHIDLRTRFADTGLQVIFKLANIHLTPEKPRYPGGTWHVEGALNEHICATALYYYDQSNITDSHLSFRQELNIEELVMMPEQHHYQSCEAYFGIANDEAAVKELGRVLTRPGRLLTFPNVLQHQVSGFGLADPTRPGHRKILAMFLVDPHVPVLSTANVPPQDRRWWAEELRHAPGQRLSRLPKELFDEITNGVEDFPISWDQAVDIRARLMDERGAIQASIGEAMESNHFSFCEH
ncbi:hypothetical protein PG993_014112 [Apiospora rasikravindrae]|uniref:Uncharacterized protein n=1 Tax=Apiospora rasikravindrae TaxID=990691 RepID=A0ABR1RS36_9PEZI